MITADVIFGSCFKRFAILSLNWSNLDARRFCEISNNTERRLITRCTVLRSIPNWREIARILIFSMKYKERILTWISGVKSMTCIRDELLCEYELPGVALYCIFV